MSSVLAHFAARCVHVTPRTYHLDFAQSVVHAQCRTAHDHPPRKCNPVFSAFAVLSHTILTPLPTGSASIHSTSRTMGMTNGPIHVHLRVEPQVEPQR